MERFEVGHERETLGEWRKKRGRTVIVTLGLQCVGEREGKGSWRGDSGNN